MIYHEHLASKSHLRNLLVYNVACGNNSYTVPQLQRRQRSTLWPVGPESDHTDRYSVRLPDAACTCESGEET